MNDTTLNNKGFSFTHLRHLMAAMGPGVLVAAAAIGASHLVASTRAGAEFGWQLAWLVVLVNLLKYPFFAAGARYTAATGESLLEAISGKEKAICGCSVCSILLPPLPAPPGSAC